MNAELIWVVMMDELSSGRVNILDSKIIDLFKVNDDAKVNAQHYYKFLNKLYFDWY